MQRTVEPDTGTAGNTDLGTVANPNIGVADNPGDNSGSQNQDFEKVAREKGWKPKEEFDGDTESWVGAEEFIKRQPLYDKMRQQSKRIKELDKTVNAMASHYNITIKQAKEKAIAELKAERKTAIELGEVSKVEFIDQQIEEVKSQPELDAKPTPPEEIATFMEKHKTWFNVDKAMTRFAVSFNESYLAENPGKLEESLKETEKAVKSAFPDKFENPRKSEPPAVDGGTTPAPGKNAGKYTLNRLTKEQKLVYDQLVTTHQQMKHDDYFKQLEEAGFLEG